MADATGDTGHDNEGGLDLAAPRDWARMVVVNVGAGAVAYVLWRWLKNRRPPVG